MNILFIIDPLNQLNPEEDTSLAVMYEAARRTHTLFECTIEELLIADGKAQAQARKIKLSSSHQLQWETLETRIIALNEMQVIFMRKDPPFESNYLTATYILSRVDSHTTLVVNDPSALREHNEKLHILDFPQYIPPTLVADKKAVIRTFVKAHHKAVIKPLYEYGGRGICILSVDDPNTNALIELLTDHEAKAVMVQRYLPEARQGDIRVIVLNGKIIGAENRISRTDDHRNNISRGGEYEKVLLSSQQTHMCEDVAKTLSAKGIYFAGLDVIGNYITEINITSPTGIATINKIENSNLETLVIDFFEDYAKYLTQ